MLVIGVACLMVAAFILGYLLGYKNGDKDGRLKGAVAYAISEEVVDDIAAKFDEHVQGRIKEVGKAYEQEKVYGLSPETIGTLADDKQRFVRRITDNPQA